MQELERMEGVFGGYYWAAVTNCSANYEAKEGMSVKK
jgi:hypothetical protein